MILLIYWSWHKETIKTPRTTDSENFIKPKTLWHQQQFDQLLRQFHHLFTVIHIGCKPNGPSISTPIIRLHFVHYDSAFHFNVANAATHKGRVGCHCRCWDESVIEFWFVLHWENVYVSNLSRCIFCQNRCNTF